MKVYVSGSWKSRGQLRQKAERLRLHGHQIVSTWLEEQDRPDWMPEATWLARIAQRDVAEVAGADAILMDISEDSTTGGRYVEWGVACHPHAAIMRVLIGTPPDADIFGRLADYTFPDWDAALAHPVLAQR